MKQTKLTRPDMVNEILRLLDNLLNYKHDDESKEYLLNALKLERNNLAQYDHKLEQFKNEKKSAKERKRLFGAM